MKICKLCDKEIKEYQKKCSTRCGSCNTKIRRFRAKAAAIKMLGGKCQKCGWAGDQAALQFHHLEPDKKDFILGGVGNKSWDSILNEIKKCALLCANCHTIEHTSKRGEKFLTEAANYRGRLLKF
ncbi:MAG: HNH endonuclease [Candidatus Zambryskibacteria bacterium]|nr:HNH endonuclease [Candidatus Zambryskibacteria bacterium]